MAARYVTEQQPDGRWNVRAPEGFLCFVKNEKHRGPCDRVARTSNTELDRQERLA